VVGGGGDLGAGLQRLAGQPPHPVRPPVCAPALAWPDAVAAAGLGGAAGGARHGRGGTGGRVVEAGGGGAARRGRLLGGGGHQAGGLAGGDGLGGVEGMDGPGDGAVPVERDPGRGGQPAGAVPGRLGLTEPARQLDEGAGGPVQRMRCRLEARLEPAGAGLERLAGRSPPCPRHHHERQRPAQAATGADERVGGGGERPGSGGQGGRVPRRPAHRGRPLMAARGLGVVCMGRL
jgi:hypothetical protein